jgi:hypothetical protein
VLEEEGSGVEGVEGYAVGAINEVLVLGFVNFERHRYRFDWELTA